MTQNYKHPMGIPQLVAEFYARGGRIEYVVEEDKPDERPRCEHRKITGTTAERRALAGRRRADDARTAATDTAQVHSAPEELEPGSGMTGMASCPRRSAHGGGECLFGFRVS